MFDDDQETPNTLTATFEFDEGGKKKMLVFEVRHWITNHEAGIGGPRRPATSIGNIFYGSKGYLVDRTKYQRYATWLGREQKPGPGRRPRADGQPLGQLHRRRAQPQAGGPERAHRGRRHLHACWCTWRTSPTGWAARCTSTPPRLLSRGRGSQPHVHAQLPQAVRGAREGLTSPDLGFRS